MSESILETLSISELKGKNFCIPDYQRGYRWTERQAQDLLEDIQEFSEKKKDNEWYCLQPVVVKAKDKKFEVLDGQQRLTTIFLILKYLEDKTKLFTISYETRAGSEGFLNEIKESEKDNDENIDFYHIQKVYNTICVFFEAKDKEYKDKFKETFLDQTKVIWYEADENIDAHDLFTRINMGKIPLTNAELVKALFLNSSNFEMENLEELRIKQLEIAGKWDAIEQDLQNDEIWYFIANDTKINYATRIDFLLEIISSVTATENDPYATFRRFSDKFKKSEKNTEETIEEKQPEEIIDENWKEIKNLYQTIKDWYADKELFHKIGYLVARANGEIKSLYDESKGKTKTVFKTYLDDQIKKSLDKIDLDSIEYNDKANIHRVLLLHNVQTMLGNENSTARFPFDKYKKEKWDIEHINSQNDKLPQNEKDQIQWLKDIEEFCQDFKYPLNDKKGICISDMIEEGETENDLKKYKFKEEFKNNFEKIVTAIDIFLGGDNAKEDKDTVANLCLLDSSTNRSYGNSLFPVKRKTIIENAKNGTFIPICTKNVFLKLYSEKITQMSYWGDEEQTTYLEDIKAKLKDYLDENSQNQKETQDNNTVEENN